MLRDASTGNAGGASTEVNPAPLSDVHERVKQKYATEGGADKAQTGDLAGIAAAGDRQCQLLSNLHEDNMEMIKLLKPSTGSVLAGESTGGQKQSTRSNTKPVASPNYHQWKFGKANANASKQVITTGK
jgi:hypothetical protein